MIELACCTSVLLSEISKKEFKQKDIAKTYALKPAQVSLMLFSQENKMLYQIHHQSRKKPDQIIFCVQHELPSGDYATKRDVLKKAINKAWEKWPPPEGYQFLICTEKSPYFLMTTKDDHSATLRIINRLTARIRELEAENVKLKTKAS